MLILPREKESKFGSKEPQNRQKINPLTVSKMVLFPLNKRLFDLVFSLLALFLGVPLFACIALLIKATSSGPIFYSSLRLGERGKPFKCWKFRSMYRDAEGRLEGLLSSSPEMRQEWEAFCKLKDDPRLTPLGKILRKTSLDELPQFWNVLKGDLSIVGPRPYLPRESDLMHQIIGDQMDEILSMRPGITGLWQTSGRNALTFEERLRLDLCYKHKRSFFYDLKLFLKTIPLLFFSRGAF